MGWSELFEIARRRHGVVGLVDAERADLSKKALRCRSHRDGWERLHPGVWLVGGHEVSDLNRLAAAVLAGKGAVAGRRSSLWLHGVIDDAPRVPQVIVPYGARGPMGVRGIRVARTRRLPDDHVERPQGVPATNIPRSLLDLAENHTRRAMRYLIIDAQYRTDFELGDLAKAHANFGCGRRGMKRLGQVICELQQANADSGWEVEVRQAISASGLPVHPGPFPYRCEDGRTVHLDVALPRYWVAVECDGRTFHSDPGVFASDRRRWNQVSRDWQIVWVTWHEWQQARDEVVANVHAAVAAASGTRAPARPAV